MALNEKVLQEELSILQADFDKTKKGFVYFIRNQDFK